MEERVKDQEKSSKGLGLGLGIDLDVDLDLSGLRGIVNDLTDVLAKTGDVATDALAGVIRAIREYGIENIKKLAVATSEEAKELYHKLVSKLQEAAERGEEQARDVLHSMGEGVETTGRKMQNAAAEDEEVRH
jgi:hypothetical protein